jgi:hypothetical protein
MRKLRWMMLGVAALALTGCLQDQKDKVAECEKAGEHAYPGKKFARGNEVSQYIVQCMKDAGYDFDNEKTHPRCRGEYVSEASAYCYMPQGAFARFNFRNQLMFAE